MQIQPLKFGAVYSATINPKKDAVDAQVEALKGMIKANEDLAALKGEKVAPQEVDRAGIEKAFDETAGKLISEIIFEPIKKSFGFSEPELKETLKDQSHFGRLDILSLDKNGELQPGKDTESFIVTGDDLKKVVEMLKANLKPKPKA